MRKSCVAEELRRGSRYQDLIREFPDAVPDRRLTKDGPPRSLTYPSQLADGLHVQAHLDQSLLIQQ